MRSADLSSFFIRIHFKSAFHAYYATTQYARTYTVCAVRRAVNGDFESSRVFLSFSKEKTAGFVVRYSFEWTHLTCVQGALQQVLHGVWCGSMLIVRSLTRRWSGA